MIAGRYQSLDSKERIVLRDEQKVEQMAKCPNYGNGMHVKGNKKPGQFRGGHKCNSGRMTRNSGE